MGRAPSAAAEHHRCRTAAEYMYGFVCLCVCVWSQNVHQLDDCLLPRRLWPVGPGAGGERETGASTAFICVRGCSGGGLAESTCCCRWLSLDLLAISRMLCSGAVLGGTWQTLAGKNPDIERIGPALAAFLLAVWPCGSGTRTASSYIRAFALVVNMWSQDVRLLDVSFLPPASGRLPAAGRGGGGKIETGAAVSIIWLGSCSGGRFSDLAGRTCCCLGSRRLSLESPTISRLGILCSVAVSGARGRMCLTLLLP